MTLHAVHETLHAVHECAAHCMNYFCMLHVISVGKSAFTV